MYFMSVWDKKDRKDKKSLQENPGRRIRYRQALSQACCFSFSPGTLQYCPFCPFCHGGREQYNLIYSMLFRVCLIGQKGQKGQNVLAVKNPDEGKKYRQALGQACCFSFRPKLIIQYCPFCPFCHGRKRTI